MVRRNDESVLWVPDLLPDPEIREGCGRHQEFSWYFRGAWRFRIGTGIGIRAIVTRHGVRSRTRME